MLQRRSRNRRNNTGANNVVVLKMPRWSVGVAELKAQ